MLNIAVVLDKIPYSSLSLICLSDYACMIVKVEKHYKSTSWHCVPVSI